MWEGQFEFLGEAFPEDHNLQNNNNHLENGLHLGRRKMRNGLKNGLVKGKPDWLHELNDDVSQSCQSVLFLFKTVSFFLFDDTDHT